MKKLALLSFLLALVEGIYVFLVALLMLNAQHIFGAMPQPVGMASFLLLFVVSVAVSGALILGKPVLLYLEGHKLDALKIFFMTIGWLVLFFLLLTATLVLV